MSMHAQDQGRDDLLKRLMETKPADFNHILNDQSGLQVQIIYSEINREKKTGFSSVIIFTMWMISVISIRHPQLNYPLPY